jgi:ABC-2 type transport system permease protein
VRVCLAFFRIGLQEGLAYRAEAAIWFLFDLLPPLVMIMLWLAVYQGRADVAGYSLEQMLGYYVGMLILGTLLTSHLEWGISHDVRQGVLSGQLIRPVSPWLYWFVDSLAWKSVRLVFLVPSTLVILLALGGSLHLAALSPARLGLLGVSLVAAYFLCFVQKALIGLAAFWLTDVTGLSALWDILVYLLGGAMLPLELLPGPLQQAALVLPFRYLYAYPLAIALGRLEPPDLWSGLALQVGWLAACLGLTALVWRRALRRYEAVGN